jgi:hypothetical protein
MARAELSAVEAGTAVQIAGRDPETVAEACLRAGIGAGALDTELVEAA